MANSIMGIRPGEAKAGGDKADSFSRAMKSLAAYCKRFLPAISAAVLLAAAGAVFNIIGPDKLSDMTNIITAGLVTGIDIDAVTETAVLLLLLYVLGFLFNFVQGIIMSTVAQKIAKSLRTDISQKINRLPLKYFDQTTTGDVLSRITNDVDMIGQTLNQSLGTLVSALTMFFGSIIMMFHTNWIMAASGIAAAMIGFALMLAIVSRSQKYFVRQQNELGLINGYIEEIYTGHLVVKVYNGEKEAREVFRSMNQSLYESAWKSQFMSGLMQPLMAFIGNFGYVVVCIAGAILTMNGSIQFGTIVAFMIYIRLFTQPMSQIAQVAASLQSTAAASERVFNFLSQPEMEDESGKRVRLAAAKGRVEFCHVRFGYSEDKVIIHDFSARIEAGQKIAIVGPTGAGKTTMVNLLMRFYETDGGAILLDGTPIEQMTRESIRELFGMVLQDTWLFEGTIRENIVFSKEGVSDEEVRAVCEAVGLHSFIKTLPNGYDTVLNDKSNLSAGQKQLLTIARAIVKNAPMLILDEATSSVDTRTEILIQKAMDRLMEGRTSFVIAHRLSTIRNADLILVMRDGDIVESGTHEALMKQNGFYAELYNSQFEQK